MADQAAARRVADILTEKKASIRQAPGWDALRDMTWEEIEEGARANRPGYKAIRKLLTDRFNK
ncbi:MAG: hypothetical protein GEU28_14395 [Dehalococcoidia bacterium]|nr:hypothetical protein [Dehalococcoidia bacterium]